MFGRRVLCSLHACWEFLFPVLRRDACPFEFQFLSDVLLLALLVELGVLVVLCQTFLQYRILLPTLEHHEETRFSAAVGEGWRDVEKGGGGRDMEKLEEEKILNMNNSKPR